MHTMKISFLLMLLSVAITTVLSQDDSAKRNNLLLRRQNPRGNLFAKTTTTSTTEANYNDEEEYDDSVDEAELPENEGSDASPATTTTTTTEKPKNLRPTIRPFRSNDDLLAALKKRRQESKVKPVTEKPVRYDDENSEQAKPVKSTGNLANNNSSINNRKFGGRPPKANAYKAESREQTGADPNEETSTKSLVSRLGRSRFALKQ